jgi:hypothetical protein
MQLALVNVVDATHMSSSGPLKFHRSRHRPPCSSFALELLTNFWAAEPSHGLTMMFILLVASKQRPGQQRAESEDMDESEDMNDSEQVNRVR